MHKIYYAGIGSRSTPPNILDDINKLAYLFANRGYTLRSGAADGADLAFEYGVGDGTKEIFLPWKGFNKSSSPLFDIPQEAFVIAEKYHPAWNRLRDPVKKLMARNVQQVLGKNLDSPSSFVVCWTPDGCTSHETRTQATGGTGQAISIASESGILVINLKNEFAIDQIQYIITELQQ